MYQLIILVPRGIDEDRFHRLWPEFLHHAEQMPGLIRETVDRVDTTLYGPSRLNRIYAFAFPDRETLQEALSSEWGETAGELIHRCTSGQATIIITEHRQEMAERLRSLRNTDSADHA